MIDRLEWAVCDRPIDNGIGNDPDMGQLLYAMDSKKEQETMLDKTLHRETIYRQREH